MNMKPLPQAIYYQIGILLADVPDLKGYDVQWNLPTATLQWLAKATALVKATGDLAYTVRMESAAQNLIATLRPDAQAREIVLVLNQVFAMLELEMPAGAQGAFVTTGASLDAYAAISKIIGESTNSVLIVDPYMDASAVIDVAGLAPAGIVVRLLSDAATVKPTLKPAVEKWVQQYGADRPLEVRLAPTRSLHDRLIVTDAKVAWVLTQSLKDFARRSPATIQRADAELAAMKIQVYGDIWKAANVLS